MTYAYTKELETALGAVHLASRATKSLLHLKDKGSRCKADNSPVTIADYASQAILIAAVYKSFPNDHFLGEESAKELRKNPVLCEQVWTLISETLQQSSETTRPLQNQFQGIDDMLRFIDLGGEGMGGPASRRLWVLDPLDGTATFVKSEQYAVCLTLLEDGDQKVGVIGCPNLPFGASEVDERIVDTDGHGCILNAVHGQGAFVRKMEAYGLGPPLQLTALANLDVPIRIVQPSNTSYAFAEQQAVAQTLGAASWPGTQLWSSQMRFVALALGGAGTVQVAFRIPRDYHSAIWDVAGGALIFSEAGGRVTDADGTDLDFTRGRRLEGNWGIVAAAPAALHERVLEVAKAAVGGDRELTE